jgi:site-specific DNA-adenine methylase
MFTRQELNVLQQALRQWNGPYLQKDMPTLTKEEIKRHADCLRIAESLAERLETILTDYYEMEHAYLDPRR